MRNLIKETAREILAAKNVTALTGSGISLDSGIPTFRGKNGVWEKYDPMEFAHIDAFNKNPKRVWEVFLKDMKELLDNAKPNDAHHGLFFLEQIGKLKTVITQNIDGLHQAAGNTDVIEYHGTMARQRCVKCRRKYPTAEISLDTFPPRCECSGILRPDFVFFGEPIPSEPLSRSSAVAAQTDIMLVIGTSAVVQPAASIPWIAKNSGARIIEINMTATPLTETVTDCLLLGNAGEILSDLTDEIKNSTAA